MKILREKEKNIIKRRRQKQANEFHNTKVTAASTKKRKRTSQLFENNNKIKVVVEQERDFPYQDSRICSSFMRVKEEREQYKKFPISTKKKRFF